MGHIRKGRKEGDNCGLFGGGKLKGNINKTRGRDARFAHQVIVSGRYRRFGWRKGVAILLVLGIVRVYGRLAGKDF